MFSSAAISSANIEIQTLLCFLMTTGINLGFDMWNVGCDICHSTEIEGGGCVAGRELDLYGWTLRQLRLYTKM
jgi:hypothetical protein